MIDRLAFDRLMVSLPLRLLSTSMTYITLANMSRDGIGQVAPKPASGSVGWTLDAPLAKQPAASDGGGGSSSRSR